MSGTQWLWPEGIELACEDLADDSAAGAAADDRVYEVLLSSVETATGYKEAIPLEEESDTDNPRLLIIPATGGDQGKLILRRCALIIFYNADSDVSRLTCKLQGTLRTQLMSALIGANASGNPRIDRVYAKLTRVSTSVARIYKTTTDDIEITHNDPYTDTPAITIFTAVGTPAGSPTAPALPVDTATEFYFSLGLIYVADGYASTDEIQQGQAASEVGEITHIEQDWKPGGIPVDRLRGMRAGSIARTPLGANGSAVMNRLGAQELWVCPFKHTTTGGGGDQTITLDDTIDWSQRFVTVRFYRPPAQGGEYRAVDNPTFPGGISDGFTASAFTGFGSGTIKNIVLTAAGVGGADITVTLSTFVSGGPSLLRVNMLGNPKDATNGDNWWVELDVSPRFSPQM